MKYRHVGLSEGSIDVVVLASARVHGPEGAGRYLRLIRAAIEVIAASPSRPGSDLVPRVPAPVHFTFGWPVAWCLVNTE